MPFSMNKKILTAFLTALLLALSSGALHAEEALVLPASVDRRTARRITLQEALVLSIENNLGIRLKNEEINIALANLIASKGRYEPKVSGNFDYNNSISPPPTLQDGELGSTFRNLSHRWSLTLQQNLSVGTNFSLAFANSRNRSDFIQIRGAHSNGRCPEGYGCYRQRILREERHHSNKFSRNRRI